MAEFRFYYKCRMCGETYTNKATGSEDTARQYITEAVCNRQFNLYDVHYCGDNRVGIADYIGNKKEVKHEHNTSD